MPPLSADTRHPRIAVIVVHGVADQPPFDSVRAIGNLLQNVNEPADATNAASARYEEFREHTVRIVTRPAELAPRPEILPASGIDGPMQRTADYESAKGLTGAPRTRQGLLDTGHIFIQGQLARYRGGGPGDSYETLRLEGARRGDAATPSADIHIYELYWADLSRLGQGFVQIFGELYQLLFHLSSLGSHTVASAFLQDHPKSKAWKRFNLFERRASTVLAVHIAVLNLFLVALTAVALAVYGLSKLTPNIQAMIAFGLPLAVTTGFASRQAFLYRGVRFGVWAVPIVLLIFALFGLAVWARDAGGNEASIAQFVFAAALIGVACSGVVLVLKNYDARRPGVYRFGRLAAALLGALWIARLVWLTRRGTASAPVVASLNFMEVVYLLLACALLAFAFYLIAAHFAGNAALAEASEERGHRSKDSRVVATARLLLALPFASFLILTVAIWAGLAQVALRSDIAPICYQPLLALNSGIETVQDLAELLVEEAGTLFLLSILCLVLLAIVLTAWSLFPVVWAEIQPPKFPDKEGDRLSVGMGSWLNNGYSLMRWAGRAIYVAIAVLYPLGLIASIGLWLGADRLAPEWLSGLARAREAGRAAIAIMGTLVVGSAGTLLALRGRVGKLALGFRTALDVLLDVDSYLREHPRDSNPKVRMFARFASLLRHVSRWETVNDKPRYDAIVIVAHSQGSVLTADFLRFLRTERSLAGGSDYDPQLAALGESLPVYLFTMGCPLRQLYGLRFPHLFGWARHEVATSMERSRPGDIPNDQSPDPTELGVRLWVNAFRSGDYVGRYLWRSDSCAYQWLTPARQEGAGPFDPSLERPMNVSEDSRTPPSRREFCIGAGAHTHYWDGTAGSIAVELDRIIANAALSSVQQKSVDGQPLFRHTS